MSLIVDDWDSVVEAYQLDTNSVQPNLNDNACLRIIKHNYHQSPSASETYAIKVELMYNQSMLADIVTNESHFN